MDLHIYRNKLEFVLFSNPSSFVGNSPMLLMKIGKLSMYLNKKRFIVSSPPPPLLGEEKVEPPILTGVGRIKCPRIDWSTIVFYAVSAIFQ